MINLICQKDKIVGELVLQYGRKMWYFFSVLSLFVKRGWSLVYQYSNLVKEYVLSKYLIFWVLILWVVKKIIFLEHSFPSLIKITWKVWLLELHYSDLSKIPQSDFWSANKLIRQRKIFIKNSQNISLVHLGVEGLDWFWLNQQESSCSNEVPIATGDSWLNMKLPGRHGTFAELSIAPVVFCSNSLQGKSLFAMGHPSQ